MWEMGREALARNGLAEWRNGDGAAAAVAAFGDTMSAEVCGIIIKSWPRTGVY